MIGVNVSFFYVWDSTEAANEFFSDEVREMVTGLYGGRADDRVCRDRADRRQLGRMKT